MKVFVVIVEDRHSDTDVEVFTTADKAIEYAKSQVEELASHPEYIEEQTIDGWLYYCQYSVESDSVRVIEKDLTSRL